MTGGCLEITWPLFAAAAITAFAIAVGYAYGSNMKLREEDWS